MSFIIWFIKNGWMFYIKDEGILDKIMIIFKSK